MIYKIQNHKISNSFIAILIFILTIIIFSSCTKRHNCPANVNSKEYTSEFMCKQHCKGSGSDHPCKCPMCGSMQLDSNQMNFSCPMHKEMKGIEHQNCIKCGKPLEKLRTEDGIDMRQ